SLQREADPMDTGTGLHRRNRLSSLRNRRGVREEARRVPGGPEAEGGDGELGRRPGVQPKEAGVLLGCLLWVFADRPRVDVLGWYTGRFHEMLPGRPVVAVRVVVRHEALVGPEEVNLRPGDSMVPCQTSEEAYRGSTARDDEPAT